MILEGEELWLFAQTKWIVCGFMQLFRGKGRGSLVTQRDRSNEAGIEKVSSLYDRVTLINWDGNMRDQYNYFEVFRLD